MIDHESDECRLPEHWIRTGYDADDATYFFTDTSTGATYMSAEGNRYGPYTQLTAGTGEYSPFSGSNNRLILLANQANEAEEEDVIADERGPLVQMSVSEAGAHTFNTHPYTNQSSPYRPLLPFLLVILLLLYALFRYLPSATPKHATPLCGTHQIIHNIRAGETCHSIATDHDIPWQTLVRLNADAPSHLQLDCSHLRPGQRICVPLSPPPSL